MGRMVSGEDRPGDPGAGVEVGLLGRVSLWGAPRALAVAVMVWLLSLITRVLLHKPREHPRHGTYHPASARSCDLTTRTGQGAWRITASEILPSMALLIPRCPRLPITIRSAPSFLARPTISRSTAPISRWLPATVPPATFTRQESLRSNSRDSCSICS